MQSVRSMTKQAQNTRRRFKTSYSDTHNSMGALCIRPIPAHILSAVPKHAQADGWRWQVRKYIVISRKPWIISTLSHSNANACKVEWPSSKSCSSKPNSKVRFSDTSVNRMAIAHTTWRIAEKSRHSFLVGSFWKTSNCFINMGLCNTACRGLILSKKYSMSDCATDAGRRSG